METGQLFVVRRPLLAKLTLFVMLAALTATSFASRPTAAAVSSGMPEESVRANNIGCWSSVPSPTDRILSSVAMVSADDGWAVGQNGIILHWNGDRWEEVSSPTTAGLNSISMISADDGWAVGSNDTILHWDGDRWGIINSPTTDKGLTSASMISANNGWVVGVHTGVSLFCSGGVILHWNGISWEKQTMPYNLYSIAMVAPNDGWIGGEWYAEASPSQTILLHGNGTSWCTDTSLSSEILMYVWSISMVSTDDGWAVGFETGNFSSGIILHWNGESWGRVAELPDGGLLSVDMISADDGWAVGWGGSIIHWDGMSWRSVASPTSSNLYSVAMVSDSDGWIVGASGTILHYWMPNERLYLPVVGMDLGR